MIDATLTSSLEAWEIGAKLITALQGRVDALEARVNELTLMLSRLSQELDEAYQEVVNVEKAILTVTDVSRLLGVSRPTVYRLIDNKSLPAKKLATSPDATARTVVLSDDLKQFLAGLPAADGETTD